MPGGLPAAGVQLLWSWRQFLQIVDRGRPLSPGPPAGGVTSDAVPDDVYAEAASHYDERALAALVVHIAAINAWNRLNVITGQVAGEWTAQWAG